MQQAVQQTQLPTRADIPRASGADIPAALELHRQRRQPLVLPGAAAEWAAVKRWSPSYLADVVGDVEVTAFTGLPDTEVPYNHQEKDFEKRMTLRTFVDLMRAGDRCNTGQIPIREFPGLECDFDFESFPSTSKIFGVMLWMGTTTRSGMHYDGIDNLFAQVHGTKLVILAAPEEAYNLHLFPDSHSKSQVAPEHPDLKAHPRFARARLLQATLEPGDVLYLPRGWWHYFAGSGAAISLACLHGEPLPLRYDLQVIMRMRSPKFWALLVRDFAAQARNRRPEDKRLLSPPSTGRVVYQLLSSLWSRPKQPQG